VLAVGNPSRGDDALGPLFIERLGDALRAEIAAGEVELLTDFQLQIEHALDVADRARVVFVDASLDAAAPFTFEPVTAARDPRATSHAMSPSAVLAAMASIGCAAPRAASVLAIRGERFELGEGLSSVAAAHLDAALRFLAREVSTWRATGEASAVRIEVEGTVQGVGFRPWVYRVATELGLRGRVLNTPRGVTVEAWGSHGALAALSRALRPRDPVTEAPTAGVRMVRETELTGEDALAVAAREGFVIAPSELAGASQPSIPADLAACAACLHDVSDASDRHHGYAFTSCTACGPRYAIATALPFDRGHTSMAAFALCPACAREYRDVSDRRFHAQAIACPACGPKLWLARPDGGAIEGEEPIEGAARRIAHGAIIGVQGIGGFHLACDATCEGAVEELRRRKRRDEKPFAVMARDLSSAESLAVLDDEARRVLTSVTRPIVLAPSRGGGLAVGVGDGSARVGVMLPYTPLHHVLMARVGRPLVMTSGNLGGEPIAVTHDDARRMLGAIVDAFLLHDRPIARRVEDSVIASERGVSRVTRRSRGLVPGAIRLPLAAKEPVLALGGHLKSTACLVIGDLAYLTAHLGDLESHGAEVAFRHDVESFEALAGVRAGVLAHDLHPEYASTRYATERPARLRVGVQHHVAHVLATAAEHGLDEPLLGVVFDGTGYGTDGTAWGAEILHVDGLSWRRPCAFRALPMAGGERAIREVWRTAWGALRESFGEEARRVAARLSLFDDLPDGALDTVERMISGGVNTVRARGMGRWFDALGALTLGVRRASFEGQVAMALEDVAAGGAARAYPFALPRAAGVGVELTAENEIDLRPTVRAAVADLLAGVSAGVVSARFHQTVVEATTEAIESLGLAAGVRRVALTGGVFQNRRLERGFLAALGADRAVMGREVPVNDGGIALGQALAGAVALARGIGEREVAHVSRSARQDPRNSR
jgi:hydrogenase maturation protein HypF